VCVQSFKTMNPTDDYIYGPNEVGELNGGCRRCNVMYGSATELKLHFATIHQRQTFECFVCNKLFLQKFNFLAHIDRVHPDLGKNFSCQFCDRVYTTKDALNEHIKQSHKNPLLICPMCQKVVATAESLKRHVQHCCLNPEFQKGVVIPTTKSSPKSSSSTSSSALEILDVHPYQCMTCHKSYKSQSGLAFHNKTNHQDTEHRCHLCGKSFSRPSNVQRHIETIHTKTKTFPCKWCGKDFRSTGGRDMHIHAEHNGIRFSCNICFKEFKRKGSLDRHMIGVHKKDESSVFKCSICLKEFKQKSHLKTHMKNVHHQELVMNDLKARSPSPLPTQVPHHTFHVQHFPVFPTNVV